MLKNKDCVGQVKMLEKMTRDQQTVKLENMVLTDLWVLQNYCKNNLTKFPQLESLVTERLNRLQEKIAYKGSATVTIFKSPKHEFFVGGKKAA